jgi:hypothetical protein
MLIDKDKVIAEIDAIEEIWSTGNDVIKKVCHMLRSTISHFPPPAEPEPMVRWRTVIETPIGVDEEFHTNLDAAEEYIGMCALDRPSKITKCEIREVQND